MASVVVLLASLVLLKAQVIGSAEVDISTFNVVRRQGFKAVKHNLTTSDGYILDLIEVGNPKIDLNHMNKDPILFIHGTFTTANFFVAAARDARPANLANKFQPGMSRSKLVELLASNPASKSLAFAASNMGLPVFLLNRRGSRFSLGHRKLDQQPYLEVKDRNSTNKESTARSDLFGSLATLELFASPLLPSKPYNPKYWTFSLDEQARYDLPEAIDLVLKKTGRKKVILVGFSTGAALPLMSLCLKPELEKKSKSDQSLL